MCVYHVLGMRPRLWRSAGAGFDKFSASICSKRFRYAGCQGTGRRTALQRSNENMLLQQQASINQAITVAKACIKNASLPQVLRDPQGNVNTVPNTDLVNCTRKLTALLNDLAANQKALNNLSQDAEMEASRIVAQTNQLKLQQRLQILNNGLPMTLN